MIIRNLDISDYDETYALWISARGMGLNDVDDTREGFEKFISRNPSTCFAAEDGGEIIGVIMSGHDGRRGYIYHTAVADKYRRRGIGSMLVKRAVSALDAEGITKIALVAFADNKDGNAFWENVGFTVRDDIVYRNKSIHMFNRIGR